MKQFMSCSFMILSLVAGPSAAGAEDPENAPTTSAWEQLGIVRVDHRSSRLFVVPPDGVLASKEAASAHLRQVANFIATELPAWEADWRISFFSSPDFAGYKTEFMETEDLRVAWGRAYLAEFDRETGRLTYARLDPKKVKHDIIELD